MSKHVLLGAVAAIAILASPAIAHGAPAQPKAELVAVSAGWVREAPPGAAMMAAYLTLANKGTQPLTLDGVKSPLFKEVQMHTVVHEEGRESMKQVPSFTIPAAGSLVFQPGGNHFMLMHPTQPLKVGNKVPFELAFGKAGVQRIVLEVKPHAAEHGGGMHDHS